MTARLTRVIAGTLTQAGEHVPVLRYVTEEDSEDEAWRNRASHG